MTQVAPERVQAFERGIAVIRAFGGERRELTLSEVAEATGLVRAAARRFLLTLVELGYVRSEGRSFALRPRVLELGYAYLSGLGLSDLATPHLEALVDLTRESSSISVLDGREIVYVVRVPTKRIMTIGITVGTRLPAFATSMGRVLLAGLPPDELEDFLAGLDLEPLTAFTVSSRERLREAIAQVRNQGYAIVDQELEQGLRSAAAPIRNSRGVVIAAVNISVHASRVSVGELSTDYLPQLLDTTAHIERALRRSSTDSDGRMTAPVRPHAHALRRRGQPSPTGAERDRDFVQALERGIAVIRAFGGERRELTLSEVAEATGLVRAAARRFLLTLVELGYVRSEGRSFALRPRVLELGYAYLSGLGLSDLATPHLEALVDLTRESSSISVLDGREIVYVVRVPTKRIMTIGITVGTRLPAFATSMGRVLLAGLPPDELEDFLAGLDLEPLTAFTVSSRERLREAIAQVRNQGYAIVDQELEQGLRSAAAPIRNSRGVVIAAVNISVHASRVSVGELSTDYLPQLLDTTAHIEADIVRFELARSVGNTSWL